MIMIVGRLQWLMQHLLFKLDPCDLNYDVSLMRKHILNMFEKNTIECFPTICSQTSVNSVLETMSKSSNNKDKSKATISIKKKKLIKIII